MRHLHSCLLVAGAMLAALVAVAAFPLPAGAQGGTTGCTQFRYTDIATGQTGTICLPVAKPLTKAAAAPNVYCESGNCLITAARKTFKPGTIAKISPTRTSGGGATSGDDVCIIYKVADPLRPQGREICLPADLAPGDVACVSIGTSAPHCMQVIE